MAIYKGREVQILGRTNGEDVSPLYDILDASNERASVKFNQLELTTKEVEDLKKSGELHLANAKIAKPVEKPVKK